MESPGEDSDEGHYARRLANPLMPLSLEAGKLEPPAKDKQERQTSNELKRQAPSAGAAASSLRSTSAARERLEPLLSFLEDEHVLNPAYGLQYRRALTLEDKLEQLRASLDALPIGAGDVDRLLAQVKALLPSDRSLTLAEALAEPSPAKKSNPLLDGKSQKVVRRWLEKRRHAYRDRRVTRVTKLLQEFQQSEAAYLGFLRGVLALRQGLLAAGAAAEDVELVFGEVGRAAEVHAQLVHLGAQAAGDGQMTDPVAQRRFVAEFVLEPLLAVVRSYGTFFSNYWSRQTLLSRWAADAGLAKVLNSSGGASGSAGRLEELLQLVALRVQGYKSLVERLEVLLEEERAPERRKDDQETSARVQGLAAGIALECARLQAGIAAGLNAEQVRALATVHKLGEAWLAGNPHRAFVTQERVRALNNRKQYDDCLLLVFSDVLVLVAGKGTAGAKPGVMAQFELSSSEVEDDSFLSWVDETGGDAASAAAGAGGAGAGGEGVKPTSGFSGGDSKRFTLKPKKTPEEPSSTPALTVSPDVALITSQSSSFRLTNGEAKWHLQCVNKTARVTLVDAVLGQKYKHRVFGQSIAYLADRDGDAVPEIIRQCARELRKRTTEEGVFRIPGRGQLIDNVVKSVNMGMRVEIGDFHVHDVAGIFKIWFRQLPSSVIPRPLLGDFVATSRIDDVEERAAALKQLCEKKLPSNNLRVLSFTVGVLNAFHENRERSKMDADNLATVFAPALFFALNQPAQSKEEIIENAKLGPELKTVVAFMVAHCKWIFEDASATLKSNLMLAADKK